MDKKLRLSKDDKIVAGVCGGIGEYFNIDPTIIRIIFVFSNFVLSFTPILAYFIFWALIPKDDKKDKKTPPKSNDTNDNFGNFSDFSEFEENNENK